MSVNNQVFSFFNELPKKLTLKEQIKDHAEEIAKQNNCQIIDIKVISKIEKLQLYICKIDGSFVSLDDCANVSNSFCALLDVHFPQVRERFNIEIISAGLDRVLKAPDYNHGVQKRCAMTYINDANKQMYEFVYIVETNDDEAVFLKEEIIKQNVKNKSFMKFIKELGELLKYDAELDVKFICQLLHADSVAKVNNFPQLQQIQNLLQPFKLKYDRILKVRLAPLF